MNLPITAAERKEWNQRRNVREIYRDRERERNVEREREEMGRNDSRYNRGFSVRRLVNKKITCAMTVGERGKFELLLFIY